MNALKYFNSKQDFTLENGSTISNLCIAYQTFGTLNVSRNNVVWVFHSISGNTDVMDWWHGLFGGNAVYNPSDHLIICANSIGSPYGSSRPEDLSFPAFSIRDIAATQQLLADHLGIQHIHTAIGASFGGDIALEFAYSFPGEIEQLVLIASCSRESAWGIAIHESQRLALESDPSFGSLEGGRNGMRAARSMAMLTYRTSDVLIEQQTDVDEKTDGFDAASYIRYQGEKFVNRFNALCYYYLTKCLDSHHIGRGRGGEARALSQIQVPTLVIGIDSDQLIPVRFQKFMAEHLPLAHYAEISSVYGHDGFLVEADAISAEIKRFEAQRAKPQTDHGRTVLKFGGKSLANANLPNVLKIIQQEAAAHPIALVVSARANSTDQLIALYELAVQGSLFEEELLAFFRAQESADIPIDWQQEQNELRTLLQAISTLRIDSPIARDRVLAYGEIISARSIASLLVANQLQAIAVHAGELLRIRQEGDEIVVDQPQSRALTQAYFADLSSEGIPVITGFFGADASGTIRTLGRNGTNYSATLIASFIGAREVQNWTHVDGVYSARPEYVENAVRIAHMNYKEANELANFGADILHAKTIQPLLTSQIPLRILDTNHPKKAGTLIDRHGSGKGIKAVSTIENVSLIRIEGRDMLGRVGIDGRIFTALSKHDISVRLITQASSERGIGFVVDTESAQQTEQVLRQDFQDELRTGKISTIEADHDRAIIAIVGRHNYALEKAIQGLRKNRIWMDLISNSISGEHISLVVNKHQLKKAVRVVHSQVFGATKVLHVFALGKGTVGSKFIDQLVETQAEVEVERNLRIRVVGVADSQRFVFNDAGLSSDWRQQLSASQQENQLEAILTLLRESNLENVVFADNTSSEAVTAAYPAIIKAGFDLVTSNKKGNSGSLNFYENFRQLLKQKGRLFYYETNVGAGLPIIDTLKQLRQSADPVIKVRGVFSGSLSYLFNAYSKSEGAFTEILLEAKGKGFTESDPREDLSGMDVGRKLIILAREVGMAVAFDEVQIEGLIPEKLNDPGSFADFLKNRKELDAHFETIRKKLASNEVLRYIGELDVQRNQMRVSLQAVPSDSPLGGVKNADSIFEIYTHAYSDQPMVIQGAGAGAEVTARGVCSDLLRIGIQI